MKNLHSNEKHLADKLRNVPVPDMDRSWEEMRRLLDRDMPEGGAAGWSGNKKWWWMGITAGIIMLSVWLTQQLNDSRNEHLANTQTTEKSAAANAPDNKTTSSRNDNNATPSVTGNENNNTNNGTAISDNNNNTDKADASVDNNTPVSGDKASTNDQQAVTATPDNSSKNKSNLPNNDPTQSDSVNGSVTASDDKKKSDADKAPLKYSAPASGKDEGANTRDNNTVAGNTKSGDKKLSSPDKTSFGNRRDNRDKLNTTVKNNTPADPDSRGKTIPSTETKDLAGDKNSIAANTNATDNNSDKKNMGNPGNADPVTEESPESIPVNNALASADIEGPANVFNMAEINSNDAYAIHGKTDRESARQLRQQSLGKDDRRMSRASMRGNSRDNDREITFAAGLTIPQSFAIGSQQTSSFNLNGRSNRLTDYLPAPFFQYYINPKFFLHTELHFQSPQYTERLLMRRQTFSPTANLTLENNVYLEKLYYFNVPLNVYYSPARNFFIGTGVQYSSLVSGVASYEEKRMEGSSPATYRSYAQRFRDDSTAANLAPSEWRYQFDASYYFSRFSLGVRYNQAMRDFVDVPARNAGPALNGRNRSFLLYLRFNILEQRKKGGYYSAYNW